MLNRTAHIVRTLLPELSQQDARYTAAVTLYAAGWCAANAVLHFLGLV